ncbi:hypothetical protein FN846DRAFT_751940, partial [Sphaerosporella brunnea]
AGPSSQQQQHQHHQHHQQQQQQPYQRIARFVGPPPVALACTECRSRHLKCDAGTPSCSRCIADKRECNYIKSRRGWKGTRRKKAAAAAVAGAVGAVAAGAGDSRKHGGGESSTVQSGTDTEGPDGGGYSSAAATAAAAAAAASAVSPSHTNPLGTLRSHHKGTYTFPSQQEPTYPPPASANLMQLYYAYFHASHPFCLPPAYLIKTPITQLQVLLPVMRFVASFFAKAAPTEPFCREAEHALFGSTNPPPGRDAFTVQALLLFAIGLHSMGEQARAAQVKDICAELALELGMNRKEFSEGVAGAGADGDPGKKVLEESWRRTWWELYFVDGIMAGEQQRDNFKLWSVECTVPLPCEELDYAAGRIPEPHSLQEFDDRYFAAEDTVFSSFAYRVEAIRILGQVLSVNLTGTADEIRADAADASIANWGLHLPEAKKELVKGRERRVDEMLFQAHMVINAVIIHLNRPKSHLAIPLVASETSVTPAPHWITPRKPLALHTARTIAAANTLAKLATLPTPLIKHTPFLTSSIALACVVHLAACSWLLSGDEGFLAKERIRLAVGALKALARVWRLSLEVLAQLKAVAREVFKADPEGGVTEEEVMRFLEEEEVADWGGGAGD